MRPGHDGDIESVIDRYCEAWNEPSARRREQALQGVWAAEATYTDPTIHAVGLRELADHIGRVLARFPGTIIVRTGAADSHHGLVRFGFRRVGRDGSLVRAGVDFGELGNDGALRRIVGFFDPPPDA